MIVLQTNSHGHMHGYDIFSVPENLLHKNSYTVLNKFSFRKGIDNPCPNCGEYSVSVAGGEHLGQGIYVGMTAICHSCELIMQRGLSGQPTRIIQHGV